MNLNKIALSLSITSLLFVSSSSLIAQEQSKETFIRLLPTLLSTLLDSNTCDAPTQLTIQNATANGFQGNNSPSNAIDQNVNTRWSSDAQNPSVSPFGIGVITFELASTSIVTDLSISWFRSDERTTGYSVERSIDNEDWVEIIEPTRSLVTDVDNEFQENDVEDASANYIRILGTGNDFSTFTSISEVVINGCNNGTSATVDNNGSNAPSNEPDFGLSPNLAPWDNFDLSVWGLDSPAIEDVNASVSVGAAPEGVRVDDFEFIALSEGSSNSSFNSSEALFFGQNGEAESSDPFFFTGPDGGMVFKSPVNGARTSANTRFPRSELREYVRGGVTRRPNGESISTSGANENNWALGYQPNLIFDDNDRDESIENIGGRNGRLAATLRVNKVTETGRPDDVGVTIIGQIHAQDDEPLRLYYRKLPGFDLGSVYAVHEIRRTRDNEMPERFGRDAPDINLVGTSTDLDDLQRNGLSTNQIETLLADGIALDELFSYEIINEGELITVNLIRGDSTAPIIASTTINMETIVNQRSEASNDPIGSGYDRADEWMYYKAGAYTQNNSDVEQFDGVNTPGAATTGFGPNGDEPDYDQVTFYRLSVSHDENIVGANGEEDSNISR